MAFSLYGSSRNASETPSLCRVKTLVQVNQSQIAWPFPLTSSDYHDNSTIHNYTDCNYTSLWNFAAFPVTSLNWTNYISSVVYWMIFIVGVLGNIFILTIIAWRRSKSLVFIQSYICSLAVSDLGLLFSVTWINANERTEPSWIYGTFMCKLSSSWRSLSANCSMWTMSIIAIDRFLGLAKPNGTYLSLPALRVVIVFCWVYNVAYTSPQFAWADVVYFSPYYARCNMPYASFVTIQIYGFVGTCLNYFLPLIITWFAYIGIIMKMKRSKLTTIDPNSVKSQSSSNRFVRVALTIASTITITWTPVKIALLFCMSMTFNDTFAILLPALTILASCNSAINPFVYGFMCKPLRKAAIQAFTRCYRQRKAQATKVLAVGQNTQPTSVAGEQKSLDRSCRRGKDLNPSTPGFKSNSTGQHKEGNPGSSSMNDDSGTFNQDSLESSSGVHSEGSAAQTKVLIPTLVVSSTFCRHDREDVVPRQVNVSV